MTDFTPEQEAEIQRRIEDAKKLEQYKIAGLTGYKICLQYLAGMIDQYDPTTKQLVKEGAIDPYVRDVIEAEFERFKQMFFVRPTQETTKKDDDE